MYAPVTELMTPLQSLQATDAHYPRPTIVDLLQQPDNSKLLDYVLEDAFGSHFFPGNIKEFPVSQFIDDANAQLATEQPFHFWLYFPVCSRHCSFCQYPLVSFTKNREKLVGLSRLWVDSLIQECRLWLREMPNLADAPIGEFNLFGGTPSLMEIEDIERLMDFLYRHFNFTPETTLRVEGNPDSYTSTNMAVFKRCGFSKISCGIQSFDDHVLKLANVPHTAEQVVHFIKAAQDMGFERVNGDLIYGMLDQTVASVESDIQKVLDIDLYSVDCTKLHLKSYKETRTAIAGDIPAVWQSADNRRKLVSKRHHWPTLGEQYQMREVLERVLTENDYLEHPTMYFSKRGYGAERWKRLMVDQDKQNIEIAIGLGGSSSCATSEAQVIVDPKAYFACLEANRLPLLSAQGFDDHAKKVRSIRMTLSTCQPLDDELYRQRFPDSSLFDNYWRPRFENLEQRGFARLDPDTGCIALTHEGKIIVEAIMHTEIQ